jgi:hypothetical protein
MAIEIRLIDIQECPRADIAVAAAIVAAVRGLVEERWSGNKEQRRWDERELAEILLAVIKDADFAVIDNRRFLKAFGYPERGRARVRDLWQHLVESMLREDAGYPDYAGALDTILSQGCLARRVASAAGAGADRDTVHEVYAKLAGCVGSNTVFAPGV